MAVHAKTQKTIDPWLNFFPTNSQCLPFSHEMSNNMLSGESPFGPIQSMGSEKQENVVGELCARIGNRKGIRVTSAAPKRRLRRKVTMKCCHCVSHPSLGDSEHDFTSSIPIHAVFIFLNPLMVDLLQVEYQTKKTSPFETHAPNMWIFFVATCIHCLGLAFEIKVQNYCKLFSNFVLFSGALSSISLASVFLPHLLGWICLSLWTILPFSVGLPFIVSLLKPLYSKTRDVIEHVFNRISECHIFDQFYVESNGLSNQVLKIGMKGTEKCFCMCHTRSLAQKFYADMIWWRIWLPGFYRIDAFLLLRGQ
ncbi:hypothetical protein VNO77_20011 [Canavalia gladiata]|uniref:Uncharacterized protein n=1 Tax=Canavalia gladiata TaxID=3824 RepID=A0AAN9QIZ9_CANGL